MIIATGTLNIDENTKLAQKASKDAKKAADSASDEAGKIKTSLDGKITVSLKEPFNDGNDHEEGDIWYVQDEDHITSEMYTYDGSNWVKTKISQTALSVGQLSALTANLGTIESGYLNSVEIDSSHINAGTIDATSTISGAKIEAVNIDATSTITGSKIKGASIEGSSIEAGTIDATSTISGSKITGASIDGGDISGSSLSLQSGNTNYWLDGNGFHDSYYGNNIFNGYVKKDVWIDDAGISISDGNYKADIQPEQIKMSGGGGKGTIWSTNINWPAITIADNIQIKSQHIIHSIDYGALYFEGGSDSGEHGIAIHAGAVISDGHNLQEEIDQLRNDVDGIYSRLNSSPDSSNESYSGNSQSNDSYSEPENNSAPAQYNAPEHKPRKPKPRKPKRPRRRHG